MATIIISEKKQAVDAANKAECWSVDEVEFWSGDTLPTDLVTLDSRGLLRFTIVASFDARGFAGADKGSFIEATLRHFKFEHRQWLGWDHHQEWSRTTTDWNEFMGWVTNQSALFNEIE
jgi:hypothetical protein